MQPGDYTKETTVRKVYIKSEDTRAFGYTIGCPKCDHDRRYGPGRTTKGHSDACRTRIIAELSKTPEGLRRLNAADERVNRSIAKQIEEQAQLPPVHGGQVQRLMSRVPLSLTCDLKTLTLQNVVQMKVRVWMRSRGTLLLPLLPSAVPMDRNFRAWKLIVCRVMLSM